MPSKVTEVTVSSVVVIRRDASIPESVILRFTSGGGIGGGMGGGGGEGGLLCDSTSTCEMLLSSLFWKRHSVYVPRGSETVTLRSVRTMSAVPSG